VRAPTPEAEPRSGDPLIVAFEVRGDVAVLRARGEVDLLTAPALHDELRIRLGHHLRVVLDLSEVRFLSAAGISAVVEAHQLALSTGGALHITGAGHDCVRRPLALTRVDEILSVSTRSASKLAAELGETAGDVADRD
jgi:anti-anti-sigma factor